MTYRLLTCVPAARRGLCIRLPSSHSHAMVRRVRRVCGFETFPQNQNPEQLAPALHVVGLPKQVAPTLIVAFLAKQQSLPTLCSVAVCSPLLCNLAWGSMQYEDFRLCDLVLNWCFVAANPCRRFIPEPLTFRCSSFGRRSTKSDYYIFCLCLFVVSFICLSTCPHCFKKQAPAGEVQFVRRKQRRSTCRRRGKCWEAVGQKSRPQSPRQQI